MKLATYEQNGMIGIGAVVEDHIVDLSDIAPDMLSLIELGQEGLDRARTAVTVAARTLPADSVTLLAPIPSPRRNVMCLGLNYAEHIQEANIARGRDTDLPQYPVIFNKATTAVNAPFADIPFEAAVSEQIDWEAELGVVIGRAGKNIPREQAMRHVFGYLVINDVSARDLQWRHKQFFKGKSLDGCCPTGPWIVTADAVPNPHALRITCRVNEVVKQDSTTAHMIFNIPDTIYHLSQGMTLLPGDIIATGTPSGVGFARTPPEFLRPGDVVECEIEGIGLIRNRVTAV
ncbi:MAG: fumarylacetoacetate hydrolase family protein [Anaerolineae bacterium]